MSASNLSLCVCGHQPGEHMQFDAGEYCMDCGCSGYRKAADSIESTAILSAGGSPEGLARDKISRSVNEAADAESDPEGLNDPADADEARAGEPRTEADERYLRLNDLWEAIEALQPNPKATVDEFNGFVTCRGLVRQAVSGLDWLMAPSEAAAAPALQQASAMLTAYALQCEQDFPDEPKIAEGVRMARAHLWDVQHGLAAAPALDVERLAEALHARLSEKKG